MITSALMTANIFGTIANVYNQMNLKKMKVQEMVDVANSHMYNLKLESKL